MSLAWWTQFGVSPAISDVGAEIRAYPDAIERSFLQCNTDPSSHDFIERLKENHEVHCCIRESYDYYAFILALDDSHFVILEDDYESGSHWYEYSTLLECFVERSEDDRLVARIGRYYYQYRCSYAERFKTYRTLQEHVEIGMPGIDETEAVNRCASLRVLDTVASLMGCTGFDVCSAASGKEWLYPDVVREGLCPTRHPPAGVFTRPIFGPPIVDVREFDLGEGFPDRPGGHGDFIFVDENIQ